MSCRAKHHLALIVVIVGLGIAQRCAADVIVLANRTTGRVAAEIKPVTSQPMTIHLSPGEVLPIYVDGRAYINFGQGAGRRRYLLDANSAYYFGNLANGRVEMQKIGLGGDERSSAGRPLPGSARMAPSVTIPVKILVDEEEPTKQLLWERRLRTRVAKASTILEKHCRLKLKVVAVDTWITDNQITKFFDSLGEFEKKVNPFPGQLAIGFTNQYQVPHGRVHLGGTRGPFHTHILIREWSKHVGEPERLELLVHEMGHFLGASHSPEPTSVMRPVLGDRKALHKHFSIRFDPVNTLVMSMIVEEMRRRHVRQISELTVGTKRRLRQIYGGLAESIPDDPAAKKYSKIVDVATVSPLVTGTKQVLEAIVQAARENHKLPVSPAAQTQSRLAGDELTNFYFRRAAAAAMSLQDDVAGTALLCALGIGMDDSDALLSLPKTKSFVRSVEPAGRRSIRKAFLGQPTMHSRRDLAQHFVVSAYIAAVDGTKAAESAGLAKEVFDTRKGGSGFSFADLAADQAGVVFAGGVINRRISLEQLANGFEVAAYMPPIHDLPEGLSASELVARYGKQTTERFQSQLADIRQRVFDLPPYRHLGGVTSPVSAPTEQGDQPPQEEFSTGEL